MAVLFGRSLLLAGLMLGVTGCLAAVSNARHQNSLEAELLTYWPAQVDETSGLAWHQGIYWTINDSGGKASVYGFDQQGTRYSKRVAIKKAKNKDWEALAQDDRYLYIADCGNNSAKRKKLALYKVPWQSLSSAGHKEGVKAQKLVFRYADFTVPAKRKQHNFDCEALAGVEDELWLFTKNRGDLNSRLYKLSKTNPNQTLSPSQTLPVKGLITGADFNPETQQIALLGYQKASVFGQSFIWIVPVESGLLNWQKARYHTILPYGQWEAVMWESPTQLLISAENSPLGKQQLARINLLAKPADDQWPSD